METCLMLDKYYIVNWLNRNYILHFKCKDEYACVCILCSEPIFLQESGIEHFYKEHKEWFELLWLKYERISKKLDDIPKEDVAGYDKQIIEKIKKPKYRVHIKPWKNPNSIYCDKEFLEEFFNKKLSNDQNCDNDTNQEK